MALQNTSKCCGNEDAVPFIEGALRPSVRLLGKMSDIRKQLGAFGEKDLSNNIRIVEGPLERDLRIYKQLAKKGFVVKLSGIHQLQFGRGDIQIGINWFLSEIDESIHKQRFIKRILYSEIIQNNFVICKLYALIGNGEDRVERDNFQFSSIEGQVACKFIRIR